MNSTINDIAIAVKNMRKIAGLSQYNLAQLAGVGKTSVFDIEQSKQTVQLKTILKVCKVLNIHIKIISPTRGT